MKKLIYYLIILSFTFCYVESYAHKRAKYNIIIDTDGSIDDLRALIYFMSSRDFNINAITTVDGVLSPDISANYINNVCCEFHHEGIPVAEGIKRNSISSTNDKYIIEIWDSLFPNVLEVKFPNSIDILKKSIESESKRTIIIALGPLTNIAALGEKHPNIISKIETVLWYSDYEKQPQGYNYEQDIEAFSSLLKLKVPVKIISSSNIKYSVDFSEVCSEMNSKYANLIYKTFLVDSATQSKLYYQEDMIPFYLLFPSMFTETVVMDYVRKITPHAENYFDVLATGVLNFDKPYQGVVYNEVPTSGYMIYSDVEEYVDTIIDLYGYTEFRLVALTSEFHSHMGVYSVLGAKTGLRILEYLHAGLDEIEIISYAGHNPPLSCFNDGLQVGTGSTIGYGTIKVDTTHGLMPAVRVRYNEREILFSLKPEIVVKIEKIVSNLVKQYGLDNEMYWIKLREIAIKECWLGMSRYDILEVEEKMFDDR